MIPERVKTTSPDISVVIPVYNGGLVLKKAIDSVFKQEKAAFEVLVIDDCSSDQTSEILDHLSDAYPIRIIHHSSNVGLAASLNDGLKNARGRFILTLHQDCELVVPDWMKKALDIFRKNVMVGVVTGKSVYDLKSFTLKQKAFMTINRHRTTDSEVEVKEIPFSEDKCDMYDRRLLESFGGFPEDKFRISGEDQYVSGEIRKRGYKILSCRELVFKQEYSPGVGGLRSLIMKAYYFGRTMPGLLRHLGISSISPYMQVSAEVRARTLNRFWMVINGLAVICLPLVVILAFHMIVLITALSTEIILRALYFLVEMSRSKLFSAVTDYFKVLLLSLAFDIVFFCGFIHGVLLLIIGRKL